MKPKLKLPACLQELLEVNTKNSNNLLKKNDIKLKILQENDEKNLKLKKRCDDKLHALPQKRRRLHLKSRQYRQTQREEDKLRRTKYACHRKAWKIYHEFYAIINRMIYEQYKKKILPT